MELDRPKLMVAFDISFAVPRVSGTMPVTGIGRVIREVLTRLADRPDFDVRAVGAFAGDWNPVSSSSRAAAWASRLRPGGVKSASAYSGKMGWANWLAPVQLWLEERALSAPTGSIRDRAARALRKLVLLDYRPGGDVSSADVFISTFQAPPSWLPATMPRVAFVYDVYPLRFPEPGTEHAIAPLRACIADLSGERDVVVAISEFTKGDFCELTGFPAERVVVAPLAADDNFRPGLSSEKVRMVREKLGIASESYFLSVANPQPRKNLSCAVRAFAALCAEKPEWDGMLVLAGNQKAGWRTELISEAIGEFPELSHRIKVTGPVPEEDLPALYVGALALLFPSLYEGFGLPVLEAMQVGTPVVCSRATSLPEVTGAAAVLVDPWQVPEWTSAMQRVVEEEGLRARLASDGVQRAAAFSWDRCASSVAKAIGLAANR